MKVPNELIEVRRQQRRRQDAFADAITQFSGPMAFVYLHIVWFAFWIIVNTVSTRQFDPFPFGLLTLVVSLEAIFLSTFVLISQNRQGTRADIRARIDFQTNVQSEVWTELLAEKLGIDHEEVARRVHERINQADSEADQARAG
jgi:uncharacterized membrane protein